MRGLYEDIRRELRAIFSDSGALLLLVIALPLYTIIYSTAYGSEVVREVAIAVVDEDKTSSSRELVEGLRCGPRTRLSYEPANLLEAKRLFYTNACQGIVYIPSGFEQRLLSNRQADIGAVLDGSHLLLYRQVLEQLASDALLEGAHVELQRLTELGVAHQVAMATVDPITLEVHNLYNRALGYGTFVMPSVVMVIIQQTLVIGLAMIAARRRERGLGVESLTARSIIAKVLTYTTIYGINLTIILTVVWPAFGFVFEGDVLSVSLFTLLYVVTALSLGIAVAELFKHRESPLLLLLWSSVPILLLAGVSYPHETYPEWMYALGRLFPSSCGVDGFIALASRGATLGKVTNELLVLAVELVVYTLTALIINKRAVREQKI